VEEKKGLGGEGGGKDDIIGGDRPMLMMRQQSFIPDIGSSSDPFL